MPRRGKSIQLHIVDGKSHLTKKEIEFRQKNEIRLGGKKYECPETVAKDRAALKKWNELIELYRDFDFVTTADGGILERYCLTYSEYLALLKDKDNHAERNKKNDILIKLEDRLLLNPVSRVKNVPKKENRNNVDPLEREGFGNV